MASTVNCIFCFEKAKGFGGHVHKGDELIIAGFCTKHHPLRKDRKARGDMAYFNENCKGCYGEWDEEMGIDRSFGQMMYIDKDGMHSID